MQGKTGPTTVRLIPSALLLARYLEGHPLREEHRSSLWLTEATNRKNARPGWASWNRILKPLAKKAGIKKSVHNHMLRHGSATESARFLYDNELKIKYGWSKSSKMPSLYVHLAGKDLDDKLLAIYTSKKIDLPKPDFLPTICPRCEESNAPAVKYCKRCGTPLEQEEIAKAGIELEKIKSEFEDLKQLFLKSLTQQ